MGFLSLSINVHGTFGFGWNGDVTKRPSVGEDEEYGYMSAMVVLSHSLSDTYQDIFNGIPLPAGVTMKSAPVKTVSRSAVKSYRDYADSKNPKARHLKDPLRVAYTHSTPEEAETITNGLEAHPQLEIVGFKNTYSYPDGERKMHQCLINAVFSPLTKDGSRPLKFSDLTKGELADEFANGLDLVAYEWQQTEFPVDQVTAHVLRAKDMLELPELQDREVKLIVEVQLHQGFYLLKRKVSHFMYKAARARTIEDLSQDCGLFGREFWIPAPIKFDGKTFNVATKGEFFVGPNPKQRRKIPSFGKKPSHGHDILCLKKIMFEKQMHPVLNEWLKKNKPEFDPIESISICDPENPKSVALKDFLSSKVHLYKESNMEEELQNKFTMCGKNSAKLRFQDKDGKFPQLICVIDRD